MFLVAFDVSIKILKVYRHQNPTNRSSNRSICSFVKEKDSQLEICIVILLYDGLFMGFGIKKYILKL